MEIASHRIGREGGSRQKIVREYFLGMSFGKATDLPEWKEMAIPKGTWAKYAAGIEESEQ